MIPEMVKQYLPGGVEKFSFRIIIVIMNFTTEKKKLKKVPVLIQLILRGSFSISLTCWDH